MEYIRLIKHGGTEIRKKKKKIRIKRETKLNSAVDIKKKTKQNYKKKK